MSVGSMDLSGRWIDTLHQRKPLKELILDLDSSVSETYGRQQGTAYNGHFECACYHPLFLFNQFGDLERAMLRRGNHASAKFWRRVLIRSPVRKKYEAVFGESDGECMACWQITAPEMTLWWGVEHQDGHWNQSHGGKSSVPTGIPCSLRLAWRNCRSERVRATPKWEIRGKRTSLLP